MVAQIKRRRLLRNLAKTDGTKRLCESVWRKQNRCDNQRRLKRDSYFQLNSPWPLHHLAHIVLKPLHVRPYARLLEYVGT